MRSRFQDGSEKRLIRLKGDKSRLEGNEPTEGPQAVYGDTGPMELVTPNPLRARIKLR